MLSEHLCACALLPFLSFLLWVLLKNCHKKSHKCLVIELQSNACWKTPSEFKRVLRKMPCTSSKAAGILVKGDTDPELFEWRLCIQTRGRRKTGKPGKLDWPGDGGGRRGRGKGRKDSRRETGCRCATRVDLLFWGSTFQTNFLSKVQRKATFCKMRACFRHWF